MHELFKICFTVVAMEVLIKYCINSFPKLTNSFDRKLVNFLLNCSTSLLFVCDMSIRFEVKSNWLTGQQELDNRKLINFLSNELIQYFINTSISTTVRHLNFRSFSSIVYVIQIPKPSILIKNFMLYAALRL